MEAMGLFLSFFKLVGFLLLEAMRLPKLITGVIFLSSLEFSEGGVVAEFEIWDRLNYCWYLKHVC